MGEKWRIFQGNPEEEERLTEAVSLGRITGTIPEEENADDYLDKDEIKERGDIEKLQGDTEADIVLKNFLSPLEARKNEKRLKEKELLKRIRNFKIKMQNSIGIQQALESLEEQKNGLSPTAPKYAELETKIVEKQAEFDKIRKELTDDRKEIDKSETRFMLSDKSLKEITTKIEREKEN